MRCRQQTLCPQNDVNLHFKVLLAPMHFVVMDLKGKFNPLPQGCQYALTIIDMLTHYTCCIPLHTKEADEAVHIYLHNVYLKFGRSQKFFQTMVLNLRTSCLCSRNKTNT